MLREFTVHGTLKRVRRCEMSECVYVGKIE